MTARPPSQQLYPLTRQDRIEEGLCTNIESEQRAGLDLIDLIG